MQLLYVGFLGLVFEENGDYQAFFIMLGKALSIEYQEPQEPQEEEYKGDTQGNREIGRDELPTVITFATGVHGNKILFQGQRYKNNYNIPQKCEATQAIFLLLGIKKIIVRGDSPPASASL
jgi:hypothetical protein